LDTFARAITIIEERNYILGGIGSIALWLIELFGDIGEKESAKKVEDWLTELKHRN